nr:MAG TPA: hypothetical protein [Caudoviricetes sp.]
MAPGAYRVLPRGHPHPHERQQANWPPTTTRRSHASATYSSVSGCRTARPQPHPHTSKPSRKPRSPKPATGQQTTSPPALKTSRQPGKSSPPVASSAHP